MFSHSFPVIHQLGIDRTGFTGKLFKNVGTFYEKQIPFLCGGFTFGFTVVRFCFAGKTQL
jgi:hypothetical protein